MKRAKKSITNPLDQFQLRFYEDGNSDKKSESGLNFFWTDGITLNTGLLGALSPAAVMVPKFRSIMVVNTDAAVQYVSITDSHMLANTILAAPTVDQLAVVNGTALGVITLVSAVGFIAGDHVTVSDDNSAPVSGYVVGIVDLGGPGPYQFHIQTLPALGVDIDLSMYTVAQNAHVLMAGTYGATRNVVTGLATITTTTAHGYKTGDNVKIAGVTEASFNGVFIINSTPSLTTFTYVLGGVTIFSGAGTTGLGAPFDAMSGIAIPPNAGRLMLAIDDINTKVIASSAKVFGYLTRDTIISLPDNI